jgi:hypothetical protein
VLRVRGADPGGVYALDLSPRGDAENGHRCQ